MTVRRDHRTQDALIYTWLRHMEQNCDLDERIKQWRQIEQACNARLQESDDVHAQAFHRGIAQIARLEIQAAVTEKMRQ